MVRSAVPSASTVLSMSSPGSRTARFAGGNTRSRIALALVAALLFVSSTAWAQPAMVPTQAGNTKNQEVTSGSGAAVSVTLTATPRTRAHLYSWSARCGAATAGVTITDGGTTIWSSSAAFVGATTVSATWNPGLTGLLGNNMVITLSSCAGGVGTLDVQGDVF